MCCHVIMYESPVVSLGFLLLHPEHVAPSFMFVQGLLPLAGSAREVESRGRAKYVAIELSRNVTSEAACVVDYPNL